MEVSEKLINESVAAPAEAGLAVLVLVALVESTSFYKLRLVE